MNENKTGQRRAIFILAGGCAIVLLLAGIVVAAAFGINLLAKWEADTPTQEEPTAVAALPLMTATALPTVPPPTATIAPSDTPPPTETLAPTATPSPEPTQTPSDTPEPTLAAAYSWIPEVVHKSQATGYFASLEIDSADELHLGYFQDNYDMVWYSRTEGGKWLDPVQVTGGLGRGFHASFVLDSQEKPHFAYHSIETNKQTAMLYYKYMRDSVWMGVFKNGDYRLTNTDISLALGADDSPHFIFQENYANNIVYAQFGDNGFVNQVIGSASPDCRSFPLVIDQRGDPHIAYMAADGGLTYATLGGDDWRWEVVDGNTGAGWFSDMTLDSDGEPHLAYYDRSDKTLKYAVRSGGDWVIYVVDNAGDVGQYLSIAVDSLGEIHISYYDATNSALKYAHGSQGQWLIYTVDNQGSVGKHSSLALDSKNLPYIGYFDEGNEDLKLARAIPLSP